MRAQYLLACAALLFHGGTDVTIGGSDNRLAARFTNPSRLVSANRSGSSAISSSLRAIDQARAVMVSAEMGW